MKQIIQLNENDVKIIIAQNFNANPEDVTIEYVRNDSDGPYLGEDFIEINVEKEIG